MTLAQAMQKSGAAPFRTLLAWETRRLWRGVLPWLFVAAVPALFILTGHWQAPALQRHLELDMYLPLLGLALSAFAAWTAQRDRRTGSDEVVVAPLRDVVMVVVEGPEGHPGRVGEVQELFQRVVGDQVGEAGAVGRPVRRIDQYRHEPASCWGCGTGP